MAGAQLQVVQHPLAGVEPEQRDDRQCRQRARRVSGERQRRGTARGRAGNHPPSGAAMPVTSTRAGAPSAGRGLCARVVAALAIQ
jgi:hypothetical protein